MGGAGLGVQYMPGESLHVFIDVSPLVGHNFKPSPLSPLYPPSIMFLVGCVIRFVHVCNLDFSGDYSITVLQCGRTNLQHTPDIVPFSIHEGKCTNLSILLPLSLFSHCLSPSLPCNLSKLVFQTMHNS